MKNGFTLVELMIVVVAIGGILVAIGAGAISGNSCLPSKQSCLLLIVGVTFIWAGLTSD